MPCPSLYLYPYPARPRQPKGAKATRPPPPASFSLSLSTPSIRRLLPASRAISVPDSRSLPQPLFLCPCRWFRSATQPSGSTASAPHEGVGILPGSGATDGSPAVPDSGGTVLPRERPEKRPAVRHLPAKRHYSPARKRRLPSPRSSETAPTHESANATLRVPPGGMPPPRSAEKSARRIGAPE